MDQRCDRGRSGIAGQGDHQWIAVTAAGESAQHQAVVQHRGAGQHNLVGPCPLIADEQHIFTGRTASCDLHRQLAAAEAGRVGVGDRRIAAGIEQSVGAFFHVGDGIAVEVSDYRGCHCGNREVQRGVVLNALVYLVSGIDEGLAVNANGILHPCQQVGRRVDGPGGATTGDQGAAHVDRLNYRVVTGAYDVDVTGPLAHRLIEGQCNVRARSNTQAIVGRGCAIELGWAPILVIDDRSACGGRRPDQVEIAITIEIPDTVPLRREIREGGDTGKRRQRPWKVDEASVVVAHVANFGTVAAHLIQDVRVPVTVEVRHDRPRHRWRRQTRCTGQLDKSAVVIA